MNGLRFGAKKITKCNFIDLFIVISYFKYLGQSLQEMQTVDWQFMGHGFQFIYYLNTYIFIVQGYFYQISKGAFDILDLFFFF